MLIKRLKDFWLINRFLKVSKISDSDAILFGRCFDLPKSQPKGQGDFQFTGRKHRSTEMMKES